MIEVGEKGEVDFSKIPQEPGVYFFRDLQNEIIYIGKAKNLKKRVSSYFTNKNHYPRIALMVLRIANIEFVAVDNEVEALLLENNMIKKHSPKYNIDLKDSKTFAYIKLTAEKFPRILSTRKVTPDGKYFGPYVDGFARVQLLNLAVQLYKIRTCRILPKKECLNYHIGLCTAPCIGNVSQEQYLEQVQGVHDFLKGERSGVIEKLKDEMQIASKELKFERALEKKHQIEAIENLDERQKVELVKRYDQDVLALVKNEPKCIVEMFTISRGVISGKKEFTFDYHEGLFEEFITRYYSTHTPPNEILVSEKFWAEESEREVVEAYLSKIKGTYVSLIYPKRGEKLGLVNMAQKNAVLNIGEGSVLALIKDALNLPDIPSIIECFDVSNLNYDHVVGAMVRFTNGKPDKKEYRKFKIKTVQGKNDDFASMKEIVSRRYSRLRQESAQFPSLIIIDGGAGQLNASLDALRELGLKIPIIALAKKNEEIYLPGFDEPKQFDKNSRMMLFIRSVRDAVHKFALGYNRKRREMKLREQFKEI
ncbi:MAG TPA: excinuclease ABC subunit UvrC [archaeon]|nr:excinuclease ABC subunit UvrC [archaeon]